MTLQDTKTSTAPAARPYRLRARLRITISVLVALVVTSGVCTVLTALASHNAIARAHDLEVSSRRAALLSVVAREQYIHEAHTIILRDRSHVGHHDEWVVTLNSELVELRPDVSAEGAARLDEIREASHEISRIFATSILPAIDKGDLAEVRKSHDRANELVDTMTRHADALADYFDGQAIAAEQDADRVIRIALGFAIAVAAFAAAIALVAGRSLWRAFSTPLASLERVAERVATEDRGARVEPLQAVELSVVAEAFNRMLDALAKAEAGVVASERLAAIGSVAAGVAHEINNPIAVIRGYVKTMLEDATSDRLKDELRILDEEAFACQRIAEDLLVYARSPELVPAPVQARDLLQDAAARCDGPLAREVSPPSAVVVVDAEPSLISVDPLRIRQVLVNLITNAREATSEGGEAAGDGRPAPVVVRGSRVDDGYRIEVLDRGRGFSDQASPRLFEPFFTTRRDGTGLGLAVCYGLVTAHGGSIRAEPRPGGGARFIVDLPSVAVDEENDARGHA